MQRYDAAKHKRPRAIFIISAVRADEAGSHIFDYPEKRSKPTTVTEGMTDQYQTAVE